MASSVIGSPAVTSGAGDVVRAAVGRSVTETSCVVVTERPSVVADAQAHVDRAALGVGGRRLAPVTPGSHCAVAVEVPLVLVIGCVVVAADRARSRRSRPCPPTETTDALGVMLAIIWGWQIAGAILMSQLCEDVGDLRAAGARDDELPLPADRRAVEHAEVALGLEGARQRHPGLTGRDRVAGRRERRVRQPARRAALLDDERHGVPGRRDQRQRERAELRGVEPADVDAHRLGQPDGRDGDLGDPPGRPGRRGPAARCTGR